MTGGYGAYIWSAYGAALVLLGGLLLASLRTLRRRNAELDAAGDGGRDRHRRNERS